MADGPFAESKEAIGGYFLLAANSLDVSSDQGTGSTATPRLLLDASVDAGELRVVNSDDASLGEGGLGWAGTDNAALRAAESRACGGGRVRRPKPAASIAV